MYILKPQRHSVSRQYRVILKSVSYFRHFIYLAEDCDSCHICISKHKTSALSSHRTESVSFGKIPRWVLFKIIQLVHISSCENTVLQYAGVGNAVFSDTIVFHKASSARCSNHQNTTARDNRSGSKTANLVIFVLQLPVLWWSERRLWWRGSIFLCNDIAKLATQLLRHAHTAVFHSSDRNRYEANMSAV